DWRPLATNDEVACFAVLYLREESTMRFLIASLALIAVLTLGGFATPVLLAAGYQNPVQGKIDINVSHSGGGGGVWWQSPVWIAIGVIALILILLIIAMIGRGGGTTIVKD